MTRTVRQVVIETLRQIVDEHRRIVRITCPETCLCWAIEGALIELEKEGGE